jgi:hypothetical protein
MTKTIQLTQGKVALVDDEDYDELNKHKWCAGNDHKYERWYAHRQTRLPDGKRKLIIMHRQITDFKYKIVDHVNHDGLDNRKCNLRSCTHSQNKKNSFVYKNNTSGFIGVSWHKYHQKWMAYINKDNKRIHLGYFYSKEDASHAVDKKALELFGEFAVLNFC